MSQMTDTNRTIYNVPVQINYEGSIPQSLGLQRIGDTEIMISVNVTGKASKVQRLTADDFNASIVAQMEQNLYRRANGYEAREIKIERSPDGRERRTVTVKQIAPDTGARVFALTNRAPDRWQNRQHTDLTSGGAPLPAVIIGREADPLPIASDEAEISAAREEGGER